MKQRKHAMLLGCALCWACGGDKPPLGEVQPEPAEPKPHPAAAAERQPVPAEGADPICAQLDQACTGGNPDACSVLQAQCENGKLKNDGQTGDQPRSQPGAQPSDPSQPPPPTPPGWDGLICGELNKQCSAGEEAACRLVELMCRA